MGEKFKEDYSEVEQLENRVGELEKKMDALLNGDLSTSFEKSMLETSKQITKEIDDRYERNLRKCGLS